MAPQIERFGDLTAAVVRRGPSAMASTKPPILLIHGMFGGAWYWADYQAFLAAHGYDSYAINLRGHHGSRPVRDIGKVPLTAYVADAIEIARALGNPMVIGHSMGGLIAQKVAEAGACRALVLLSSAPPRWIPVASWLLLRKELKYAGELLAHRPMLPDRGDADDLMFNRTPIPDRDAFFARLVPESGRAGFDLAFGIVAVNAARVTAPTLVVTGTDDRFVVPRVARALARKYHAPLRTHRSFAHHIMSEPGWERPASDVVAWLDETSSRPRNA